MNLIRRWRGVVDGLAGRFALLLAAALLAANAVALVLLGIEQQRLGEAAFEARRIDRIVALVPALETLESSLRHAIAHEASTRDTWIRVDTEPFARSGDASPRATALLHRLTEALPESEIRVAMIDSVESLRRNTFRRPPSTAPQLPVGRRHAGKPGVVVSIALSDPAPVGEPVAASSVRTWLNVVMPSVRAPRRGMPGGVLLLVLGLSLVAVLGVGLVFVRRLVRPLAAMARAARAAGRGDRTVRVPEKGARELREAAVAFNDMQSRIARFDAERMRTLAAVGHDLRTPITSLRIRAEMLEDAVREPMVRTLDELAVMADGLVAYARGEHDTETLQRIELAPLLARLGEERGARFTAAAQPSIEARPVALTRAIGNLIDNALRYGKSAHICLKEQRYGNEPHAVIEIDDEGPGIAPERLESVFEPFVRGESSRSGDTGGAGLGLTIARTIIRVHGGQLLLENRDSGGLRVRVALPLVDAEPADGDRSG